MFARGSDSRDHYLSFDAPMKEILDVSMVYMAPMAVSIRMTNTLGFFAIAMKRNLHRYLSYLGFLLL